MTYQQSFYKNIDMDQPKMMTADPSALSPNPWNTNVVSPDNEAKLEESIRRRGMFKPIIVRELSNGSMQILGGAHRAMAAQRVGLKSVPVYNLGQLDDVAAKEIGLLDNSRYGADDTLQLAELLESLGGVDDLATFMPYTDAEFASIFSSVNIALDDLDLLDPTEEPQEPTRPAEKPVQTHQIMRFKVPLEDANDLAKLIEKTAKHQGFTESDSLTNAGDALVYLLKRAA